MNKPIRVTQAKRFSEIEYISIAGLKARMGPAGLHVYAEHFVSAAKALPRSQVPFEPVHAYLVCHGIELALKTFLSIKGSAMIELANSSSGHKLEALLAKAQELKLSEFVPLTMEQLTSIRQASTYYAGKLFEYPALGEAMTGYPKMPAIDTLIEAATLMVESLRKPSLEAE